MYIRGISLQYTMEKYSFPMVILDTPNILFHLQNRGGFRIESNLMAILRFISRPIAVILVITPKVQKACSREFAKIARIVKRRKGGVIYSPRGVDSDLIILGIARRTGLPIISNDKFRQSKYRKYSSVKSRVIPFYMKDERIILKKNQVGTRVEGGL